MESISSFRLSDGVPFWVTLWCDRAGWHVRYQASDGAFSERDFSSALEARLFFEWHYLI